MITTRRSGYVRIESSRRAPLAAAAIVVAAVLMVSYFVALAHARIEARIEARTWRARYCAAEVTAFYARHPRLRFAALTDPCVELELLTGEVVR